jgi:hypothetical protein
VLKKAGLIAAASVASLVTVSPLAYAGGVDDAHLVGGADSTTGHDTDHGTSHGNQNSQGLGTVGNGNNISMPLVLCNNDVQGQAGAVPVQDVAENPTGSPLQGALGLLGGADAKQKSDTSNVRGCGQGPGGAGYGN